MKKIVRIQVAAEAGNGKTTIANHITNVLRCAGLDVDLIDGEDPRQPLMENAKRFAHMVCDSNLEIKVETKQLKANPVPSGCGGSCTCGMDNRRFDRPNCKNNECICDMADLESIKWSGDNWEDVYHFIQTRGDMENYGRDAEDDTLRIQCASGQIRVPIGHVIWVSKDGKLYYTDKDSDH